MPTWVNSENASNNVSEPTRRWVKEEGYANPGELGGVFGEHWPRHGQLSSGGGVNAQVKLKAERTPGIFGTCGNLNFSLRSGLKAMRARWVYGIRIRSLPIPAYAVNSRCDYLRIHI